jgi:predicted CXXCH cytochrome family protein
VLDRRLTAALSLVAATALCACDESPAEPEPTSPSTPFEFIGSAACTECHVDEFVLWRNSHHALAMREASPGTVAAEFNEVTVDLEGQKMRFLRDGEQYEIEATDRDGTRRTFPVLSAFGVAPLQQYVVDYGGGRRQIPTIAWDVARRQWFSIHPGETIPPGDPLHWTGPLQNWNSQCAECHATAVRKGYSPATDSYETTFAEMGVGCEACHGRGSRHAQWARTGVLTNDHTGLELDLSASGAAWIMAPDSGIARRQPSLAQHPQSEGCGRCHARRTAQGDDYTYGRPLLDTHRPALLSVPLYYPDGQIHDEVFEWGSFLQSRMYRAGVACSDCHEPHSGNLRAEGDALCARCHSPARFAAAAHHRHDPSAVACVDCHMATTVYMAIDPRRDHSMRIPRPDLSSRLGVPNACAACHADRTVDWLNAAIARWYPQGRQKQPHFADAFAGSDPTALLAVALDRAEAGIVRASAWLALQDTLRAPEQLPALSQAITDGDALVRFGALQALAGLPTAIAAPLALPLLDDPVRNNRMEAARIVAPAERQLSTADRPRFERAAAAVVAAETFNADRASGYLNLGNFQAARGQLVAAEHSYTAGLQREPESVPLRLNLADIERQRGNDTKALTMLFELRARAPTEPAVHEALALTLVRLHRYDEALTVLDRAVAELSGSLRLQFLHVLAIDATGDRDRARAEAARLKREYPASMLIQSLDFDS